MWERTLQDLVRGLRANKKDESKFIARAVEEIRQEITGKDNELKAGAVLKLTYLDMLGYNMGWAAFHVVEVMSSPRIHLKSIGYLAASQSFTSETDVLMLTTNLMKKDFSSTKEDVAVALNGFAQIVTPDLARDLSHDIITMLNHSRPHIRKRAVLLMYKIFINYPEVITASILRIRERLEDSDPGVISATVNILVELSHRNPQDYLPLAPQLFHILTTSTNNWVLIKTIKLFAALTPLEPRLIKKLRAPMTELIDTTPAVSLLYECVRTCIIGGILQGAQGYTLARTCVQKLAAFLEDRDQNLKYIALLALVKIVPSHPHLVSEYQDIIMASIEDDDISIRMRALDLVSAMADRNNLQHIVQRLLSHLAKPASSISQPTAAQALARLSADAPLLVTETTLSPSQSKSYRLALTKRILSMCAHNTYENIPDFEWYISVLVDLAYVAAVDVGSDIRDRIVDVCIRVQAVRGYAVGLMTKLLGDDTFLHGSGSDGNAGNCQEVLWAAAWVCGEYVSEIRDPVWVLTHLIRHDASALSSDILAMFLHSVLKICGHWLADKSRNWDNSDMPEVIRVTQLLSTYSKRLSAKPDLEVQERAANATKLFSFIEADLRNYKPRAKSTTPPTSEFGSVFDDVRQDAITEPDFPKSFYLLMPLFSAYELESVPEEAQANVPVPDNLDLDRWINPPPQPVLVPRKIAEGTLKKVKKVKKDRKGKGKAEENFQGSADLLTPEQILLEEAAIDEEKREAERREIERLRAERLERQRNDPFYIKPSSPKNKTPPQAHDDVDSIPVVRLDDLMLQNAESAPQSSVWSRPIRASTNGTSTPNSLLSTSFPQNERADEPVRSTTPTPIVVARKKAGMGSGRKTKTKPVELS